MAAMERVREKGKALHHVHQKCDLEEHMEKRILRNQ